MVRIEREKMLKVMLAELVEKQFKDMDEAKDILIEDMGRVADDMEEAEAACAAAGEEAEEEEIKAEEEEGVCGCV